MSDISGEQRLKLVRNARARLVEDRETYYGKIDQINSELESLDVTEQAIKDGIAAEELYPSGPSELDKSMARHPAGSKLSNRNQENT